MITETSLSHPTTIKKLLGGMRLAMANPYPVYIANKSGDNFMRVEYSGGKFIFFSRNGFASHIVKKVFDNSGKTGLELLKNRIETFSN